MKTGNEVVMLPVHEKTGEVDYEYICYSVKNPDEASSPENELIDGWVYKRFKIVPAQSLAHIQREAIETMLENIYLDYDSRKDVQRYAEQLTKDNNNE